MRFPGKVDPETTLGRLLLSRGFGIMSWEKADIGTTESRALIQTTVPNPAQDESQRAWTLAW